MTPATRTMPVVDADWQMDRGWVVRLPDGREVVGRDRRDVHSIVRRHASGASIRFTGPRLYPRSSARHAAEFWSKVDSSSGAETCWAWLGAHDNKGYGRLGDSTKAHRVALAQRLGRPVAAGMLACHTCDNTGCVNPAHLYEGTVADNSRDMVEHGRVGPQMRPRERCKRGHLLTDDNIRWSSSGRQCRTCLLARRRSAPRRGASDPGRSRSSAASNAAPSSRPALLSNRAGRSEPSSGRRGTTRPQPRPADSPLRRSGHPSHTAGVGRAISRVARPT